MSTVSNPALIDPRGPSFGAGITTVVFITVLWLGLPAAATPQFDAAWWLLPFATLMFAWGTVLGPARHPYGWLFRVLIRPRLQKPSFMRGAGPTPFCAIGGSDCGAGGSRSPPSRSALWAGRGLGGGSAGCLLERLFWPLLGL